MTLAAAGAREDPRGTVRASVSPTLCTSTQHTEQDATQERTAPRSAVAGTARVNSALLRRGGNGWGGGTGGAGSLAYRAVYGHDESKGRGVGEGNGGDGQGKKKSRDRDGEKERNRAERWREEGRHLKSASGQVRECRHIRYSGWRCIGPLLCMRAR